MSDLTLIIGNKNYSSWSLRAWFFLKQSGLPFREIRIPLDTAQTKAQIAKYSPAGRVPVLLDGKLAVWDSLAICEYLNEQCLGQKGWPADPAARARARSVSAEMHSSFQGLRSEMPMNCRARRSGVVPSAAAQADIDRVTAIWESCRRDHGAGGPWLFGSISIADAMYVPVASRFQTYGVPAPAAAAAWVKAVLGHPAYGEWLAAARAEAEVISGEERGSSIN